MKQLLQSLKNGNVWAEDVPAPQAAPGDLLVQTTASLVSAGTERMLVEFGRGGYLSKARQQPEKVRQVLEKIRTDGLGPTIESVRTKLDDPLPMGYSNVGRVLEVGEGVAGFRPGDRVASNGRHAEVVCVPKHLCAKVPEGVSDEEAAFTVLGAIGLHGIRLLGPTLGETFGVFGLGLIGLLSVQMLRAHGARVVGFDYSSERVALARRFGAEAHDLSTGTDPVEAALAHTGGRGVDGVLVTAATKSDELMHQAAGMCRKRGRIVLTGVTGLKLRRDDFYEKELTFQVSCSYGPGRYDAHYETGGHDYPIGFVRWTEQRNFEAVLGLLAERKLVTAPLVSRRVPLAEAPAAYEAIGQKDVIGVVLTYSGSDAEPGVDGRVARVVRHHPTRADAGGPVLALVGAGGFAKQKILPALTKTGARLKWVCTSTGMSGATAAGRFPIEQSTTEVERLLEDPEVDALVVATRHHSHAALVVRALEAGKSVFVEKPLCLTPEELGQIVEAYARCCPAARQAGEGPAAAPRPPTSDLRPPTSDLRPPTPDLRPPTSDLRRPTSDPRPPTPDLRHPGPILMVGYNRRFAPLVAQLGAALKGRTRPLAMTFTCNAGRIPADHWTLDPSVGGGRILGEACHFIDLLHYLAGGSPIAHVTALRHGDGPAPADTVAITLRMADGSLGQINYFANGPKRFPKERLEVFWEGRAVRLDNFRRLEGFGRGTPSRRTWGQDKGHAAQFAAFVDALRRGRPSPIAFDSLVNTTKATFAVLESLDHQRTVPVD